MIGVVPAALKHPPPYHITPSINNVAFSTAEKEMKLYIFYVHRDAWLLLFTLPAFSLPIPSARGSRIIRARSF